MKILILATLSFLTFSHNSLLSQDCIDIPNLPSSQINANINDDTNYPVGTAYWNEGNIEFIKTTNTIPWNHQSGDTTLCTSNGNVVFSIANATNPKTLNISMVYEHGLIVDGDTIFDNANPPSTYSGSNFNFTYTQSGISEYTINGDFDTLEVLANNLCIYELCVEENDSLTENCVDIPNLPSNQINSNINDDVNYPVGTPFWSDGNIEFIKLSTTGPWNHQPGDTSFCTSGGNLMISVANATNPKTLHISLAYEYGLVVDGDTIFDNANPPSTYTGSGFNLTYSQSGISEYTINGDFDTLEVLANNLCIYEICLEENSLDLESNEEVGTQKITVYPNPIHQNELISIENNTTIKRLRISSINGQIIFDEKANSDQLIVPVDQHFQSGLYVVSIFTEGHWLHHKLLVK